MMKWKFGDVSESPISLDIQTLSVTNIATVKTFTPKEKLNGHFEINGDVTHSVSDDDTQTARANGTDEINSNGKSLGSRVRTISNTSSEYNIKNHAQTNGTTHNPSRYTTVDNYSPISKSVYTISNGNGISCVDGGLPHFATLNQLNKNKADPFYRSERRRLEWWLILISISLGLGNVWRFPNIAYENGGGSFVFAYLVVQVIIAQPLCFLELSLGQFTSGGIATFWKCFPLLKGLWVSQKFVTVYLSGYLGVVTALSMNQGFSFFWEQDELRDLLQGANITDNVTANSSQETYTLQSIFNLNDEDDRFQVNTAIIICLTILWVLVFICITWSKITRRVFYITSTLPIICLVSLLVYTLFQDDTFEGVKKFFKPEWIELKNPRIWYAAVGQSLFSLSIGFGHLIIFSQFNDFKHNVFRDSVLICLVDTATSLVAGVLVFAALNPLALVVPSFPGVGVSYFAYSLGLANIKNGIVYKTFLIVFFTSIYTLGISTLVPIVDSISDKSRYEKKNDRKRKLIACFIVCLLSFGIGILFSTGFLSYLMVAVERYGIELSILILSALECGGIMWGYGIKKFSADMKFMRETSLSIWWKFIWSFLVPLGVVVLAIWWHCLNEDIPLSSRKIPGWSKNLGYSLFGAALLQVPLFIFISYKHSDEYGFRMKIRGLVREESFWGPSDPVHRFTWLKKRDAQSVPSSTNSTLQRSKPTGQDNHAYEEDNHAYEEDNHDFEEDECDTVDERL